MEEIKITLFPCISCGRNMKWKGICSNCYNTTIGNKCIKENSQKAEKPSKEVPDYMYEKNPLYANWSICDNCILSDCTGCGIVAPFLKDVRMIPAHVQTRTAEIIRSIIK